MTRLGDLETRLNEIAELRAELSSEERRVREGIDEVRLAHRPVFPNARQREGIRVAAQRIRDRAVPSTHHGDPTVDDRSVLVAGNRGWLSVHHGAPFSKANIGSRLWAFTEEEIEALSDYVREQGLTVINSWPHEHGVSIVVAMPG